MRGILVHDKEFVKLHQACRHSLNGLHIEAHQTLNLLMLLKLFPDDVERETALQLQCDREKKVKAEYQRQRRGLFALVTISRCRSHENRAPGSERRLGREANPNTA